MNYEDIVSYSQDDIINIIKNTEIQSSCCYFQIEYEWNRECISSEDPSNIINQLNNMFSPKLSKYSIYKELTIIDDFNYASEVIYNNYLYTYVNYNFNLIVRSYDNKELLELTNILTDLGFIIKNLGTVFSGNINHYFYDRVFTSFKKFYE